MVGQPSTSLASFQEAFFARHVYVSAPSTYYKRCGAEFFALSSAVVVAHSSQLLAFLCLAFGLM